MSAVIHRLAGPTVLTALIVTIGCNRGPQFCDVNGKVIFDGKPLPGGTVQITNEDDTQMVFADLNIDGEFKMSRAPAGKVRVVVRTDSVKTQQIPPAVVKQLKAKGVAIVTPDPKEIGNKYVAIPAKYGDRETTDLRYDLVANKVNDLTVELHK